MAAPNLAWRPRTSPTRRARRERRSRRRLARGAGAGGGRRGRAGRHDVRCGPVGWHLLERVPSGELQLRCWAARGCAAALQRLHDAGAAALCCCSLRLRRGVRSCLSTYRRNSSGHWTPLCATTGWACRPVVTQLWSLPHERLASQESVGILMILLLDTRDTRTSQMAPERVGTPLMGHRGPLMP